MNSAAAKTRLNWAMRLLAVACTALVTMAGAASKPSLKGRLVDVEGKPIAGAKLVFDAWEHRLLVPIAPYGPGYRSETTEKAKTDANGVFRASFSRDTLKLVALEKQGFWLEPNQGLQSSWRGSWMSVPGTAVGSEPRYLGVETDIGDVLAYPFVGATELAHVKETPAVTAVIHDEQTVRYDWTAGVFDPTDASRPHLSIALRVLQEPGLPAQVRLTFKGVQAELWAADNELPFAPADHYERGLMLFATPHNARPLNFFLYLRTHAPVRFARLVVNYDWRKHELTFTSRHNTSGSRLIDSPRFVPTPAGASLGMVRNVRTDWWAELEHLMPGHVRSADYSVLFDVGRAEAAFRRHAAMIQPRQSIPSLTGPALEHLARNPTTPSATLETLWQQHANLTLRQLVRNPATPTNLLHTILSTNRESLGLAAEKNLKQPDVRRRFLRGD